MTLDELIQQFRLDADDNATPPLWSDYEIEAYLNAAEAEAATRASLLIDETTAAYCNVVTAPTTAAYALNVLILDVLSVKHEGLSLVRTSRHELDEQTWELWEGRTGTPTNYYITNGKIRLYPIPVAIGSITMVVKRLPVPIGINGPEIHARYHIRMIDWALCLAYRKRDIDTESGSLSKKYENDFAASFGESNDADVQRKQALHMPPIVRAERW